MNDILDNKLFEAFSNTSENIFIYVSDLKNNLTRWSKSAVDFFGIESEYQYDTSDKWADYIHPDDRQIFLDDITAVLTGLKHQHDCQYRARSRYGEYVWVECKGSTICDEEGKPSIFAGIMVRLDNQNKYDSLTHLLTGYELSRYPFKKSGTLMLIGIDRFRGINSRFGVNYGNRVLVYLSEIITSKAKGAMVYRFQGDEFAVLGEDMTPDDMVDIFKEIYAVSSISYNRKEVVDFTVSAGIVEYSNEESCIKVLTNCEASLSYAKDDQVNHYLIYSEEIEKKQIRRNLVSEELLKAIENDFEGFYLVYQPILDNTGSTVVSCEALVRWKCSNAEVGPCYPDEFISILENNGGINKLGYFIMRQAVKQAGIWQRKFKRFNVSFNVSYLQLEDPDFVPAVIQAVSDFDVDPSGIVVELTESVLDVDTVMLRKSFDVLKGEGIRIALDDFGTGNSSFWMLHNIDVDIVKLDQSFIRGMDTSGKGIDYAIAESVGLMCSRIGCKTVAEGVETTDIWNLISGLGFTGLQGYLFSRPIEVSDFEILLEKYNMNV